MAALVKEIYIFIFILLNINNKSLSLLMTCAVTISLVKKLAAGS